MSITRRDFVNGVLIGSGATLLRPRPAFSVTIANPGGVDDRWYGYGGVGDYAPSHGRNNFV